ncbi:MAG: hypothetical protein QM484_03560 [Woeseiaceae bacterium]
MELTSLNPFMNKDNMTSKTSLLFKLQTSMPKVSFALSLLIATLGILALLLFPYLVLTLPFDIYSAAMSAAELKDWIDSAILLIVLGLSGAFSWAIYTLRFSLPKGLDVSKEKFPHLSKLIDELSEEFGNPKIDRIIISHQYEIKVVKTPQAHTPFLNTSTLIIGLPVLQTMSPLYFKALLARRIGQLSTQHSPVTTRLYFLNGIWQQFLKSCQRSKNIFAKTLGYFFRVYNSLYQTILTPWLQQQELEADSYGMDIINDTDMVECLVYEEVVTKFLDNKFWPKIYHMAKRSKKPTYMPYSQITKVTKAGITDDEISETIQKALKQDNKYTSIMPTLPERLNQFGHSKPLPPKRLNKTAASYYLGNSLEQIIAVFDKNWLKTLTK